MDPVEEWRDVPDFPGYRVSSFGQIYSNKLKRVLNSPLDADGYCRIRLWNTPNSKKIFVHRLVLLVFEVPNPENKDTVNHKDGNRQNNKLVNLEWNTRQENNKHKIEVLGYKGTKGIHTKSITLTKDDIDYPFATTREVYQFLKCSGKSFKGLKDGLKDNINGFKIKIPNI